MGHRALVAYERSDGKYNVHYSHWGAAGLSLCETITENTPFGGENSEPEYVSGFLGALAESADSVGGYLTEAQHDTDVEPDPLVTGVTFDEILSEHLDYLHHEAFFLVNREFDVAGYRPVWFEMADEKPASEWRSQGYGGIIESEPSRDAWVKGEISGVKKGIRRAHSQGSLSESEALQALKQYVRDKDGYFPVSV